MHIPAHEDDPGLPPSLYLPLILENILQLVALWLRIEAGTVQPAFLSIPYRRSYCMPVNVLAKCLGKTFCCQRQEELAIQVKCWRR